MQRTMGFGACVAVAAAMAAACGGANGGAVKAPTATGQVAAAGASCRRTGAGSPFSPASETHIGSAVMLAKAGKRTLAFVADADDRALHVVDVDAQTEVSMTPLDGSPSQLTFLKDGRLVVLLRDRSAIQVLEPGASADAPLAKRCLVDVAPEPVALAITPDDKTLLISSGWGRALTGYDTTELARLFQAELPREPRAVVVSDDGKSAYVSHSVGSQVSVVDLVASDHAAHEVALNANETNGVFRFRAPVKPHPSAIAALAVGTAGAALGSAVKPATGRPSCQGYALAKSINPAGRILAPQVLVDPGDAERRAAGYGDPNTPTEQVDVAVLDEGTGKPVDASISVQPDFTLTMRDPREVKHGECLLPRAATVDPETRTLFVACYGIDAIVAYDAASASPARAEKRRWQVAGGPSGIALDAAQKRAVVWSQFDRTVNVISLAGKEIADEKADPPVPVAKVALTTHASPELSVEERLGRMLFHAVGDPRISRDGRACASCHPDGRDDSLVWATPEGPRRSIMLAGRVGDTAPYSWSGTEKSLEEHLGHTFDRLSGAGLTSLELQAIVLYVKTLAPPVPPSKASAGDAAVARGQQIFNSKEAGCSGCHTGRGGLTDNSLHDVKSKANADRAALFNTPTLHLVSGGGPYFHDGRYSTIHELLRSVDGKMGHTAQLSDNDLEALEAYLRTL
jgi:mono/diheme cytochrome c family protein/DNA-binding beta-propeller fold protein YncE